MLLMQLILIRKMDLELETRGLSFSEIAKLKIQRAKIS